jgi:hypothetical protein
MRFTGPTGRPGALGPAQLRRAPRLIVKSTAPEASVASIRHSRQACEVRLAFPDHLDGCLDCEPMHLIEILDLDPVVISEGLVSVNEVEVASHRACLWD